MPQPVQKPRARRAPAAPQPEIEIDIVWGSDQISKLIGRSPQSTYYLLTHGKLPAKKIGGTWVSSRAALRELFSV